MVVPSQVQAPALPAGQSWTSNLPQGTWLRALDEGGCGHQGAGRLRDGRGLRVSRQAEGLCLSIGLGAGTLASFLKPSVHKPSLCRATLGDSVPGPASQGHSPTAPWAGPGAQLPGFNLEAHCHPSHPPSQDPGRPRG